MFHLLTFAQLGGNVIFFQTNNQCYSSFSFLWGSIVKQDGEKRESYIYGKDMQLYRTTLTEMLECWSLVERMLFSYQLTGHLTLELEAEVSFERISYSFQTWNWIFSFLIGHFRITFEMVYFLIKSLRSHAKRFGLGFRNLIFIVRMLCSSDT